MGFKNRPGHQVCTKPVESDWVVSGQMHAQSNNQTSPIMPLGPGWTGFLNYAFRYIIICFTFFHIYFFYHVYNINGSYFVHLFQQIWLQQMWL